MVDWTKAIDPVQIHGRSGDLGSAASGVGSHTVRGRVASRAYVEAGQSSVYATLPSVVVMLWQVSIVTVYIVIRAGR